MTDPETEESVPVGFKLFLGAAAVYLLLRFVQGAVWLVDRLR